MSDVCDLCGNRAFLKKYRIEGAEVLACAQCGKFGTPIETPPPRRRARPTGSLGQTTTPRSDGGPSRSGGQRPPSRRVNEELRLMDGYGEAIAKARQKLGLSRKELAENLFIRETLLLRIESEKVRPKDELVKKVEKALDISLMEKAGSDELVEASQFQSQSSRNRTLTLGDFAKIRKKKDK